jgi:sensor histidine kinase YesM
MIRPLSTSPFSRLLPFAALQTLWWLMSAVTLVVADILEGNTTPRSNLIIFALLWAVLGAAVSGGLYVAARRLGMLSWHPALQALAAIVGIFLGTAVFGALLIAIVLAGPEASQRSEGLLGLVIFVALMFSAWTPAAMLVGHMRRAQQAEREVLEARSEQSEAELRTIRQQVSSHLVFNALNSILAAIDEGSPQAGSMVLDLSRLLRQSLDTLPPMGTLGDELERLELYTRIEKTRFEDDLRISLDVAAELHELPCLPMVLQPLVENAIKHGFADASPPLGIDLRAERRDGRLTVQVTNDGRLLHITKGAVEEGGSADPSTGIGLRVVRRRLESEYGAAAILELAESCIDGHAKVTATIGWPIDERTFDRLPGVAS